MTTKLTLPRLSMNMEEGTIVAWRKNEGDSFVKGEVLYEIETEKVVSEVGAPVDGRLVKILITDDSSIPVGEPVCEIEAV